MNTKLIAKLYDNALIIENRDKYSLGALDEVKFAELIVRECAATLTAESERLYKLASEEENEVFASNFEICAEKCRDNEAMIKQHFGVE